MSLDLAEGLKPLNLAKIDFQDAADVLDRGNLHDPERSLIDLGINELTNAEGASSTADRDNFINQALNFMQDAQDGMVNIQGDVGNNPPNASFSFTTDELTVDFSDTSTDSDGLIVDRSWDFDGEGTSNAENPTHTFSGEGTFSVSLTVTDDDGASSTTSQNVTVSTDGGGGGGGGTTMHIEDITTTIIRTGGGAGFAEATFLVHDDGGNPVSGATINGTFGGDLTGTDSGVTDDNGEVVLASDSFSARPFDLGICADDVTHGSLTYDPAQNGDASFDCSTAGPDARIANNNETPQSFTLLPNFPNPFNPTTEIRFSLEESGPVRLSIFNTLGQEVRVLADGNYEQGMHSITWDGKDNAGATMATGSYLYQLRFNNRSYTRTMTMIK